MPDISARDMGAGFGEFKSLASLEAKPIRKGDRVVSSMRGSFGGVLMFGMLTSFAGLGMVNPLSVGAGLLVGRKAYKEEMDNRMLRIRSDAKMNVRRFVDDISFVVGKESRDRLRFIQRQLRDHYRGIANQTTRSLNESLQATIAAAKLEENERNTRIKELERQLNILRQVTEHATKLARRHRPDCSSVSNTDGEREHQRSSARDPGRHHPGLPGRPGVSSIVPMCTTSWSGSDADSTSRSASRWPER